MILSYTPYSASQRPSTTNNTLGLGQLFVAHRKVQSPKRHEPYILYIFPAYHFVFVKTDLRSSQLTTFQTLQIMATWYELPLEIRQQILGFVAGVGFPPRLQPYQGTSQTVASYACVSREWQHIFEKYTFRTLVVYDSDVTAFCLAVGGNKDIRLSYIRHMRLSICLERYNCSVCVKDEDDNEMKRFVFARRVLHVF